MEVQTLIDEAVAEASTLVEAAKAADRPLTAEESAKLEHLEATAKSLHDKMTAAHQASEIARKQQEVDADRLAALKSLKPVDQAKFAMDHEPEVAMTTSQQAKPGAKSLGDLFVESKSVQAALDAGGFDGAAAKAGGYKADDGVGMKTLLTSPTRGSSVSVMAADHPRPLRLMDRITVLPSSAETIISHQYTIANVAAAVSEGAAKPEAELTLASVTLNPTKYAVWLPTTVEALTDHARMRAVIDTLLVGDLVYEVETVLGAAIAAWSGIATQAYSNSVVESILKGKTAASTYTMPDGILLANSDYEALALTAGSANDHYIAPGPFGSATFTLWGLPVYPSSSVPAGYAYVGRMSSLIWNEVWPVRTSTGWINTDFTENQVTILAETRGMFEISNSLHIVKTDLTA